MGRDAVVRGSRSVAGSIFAAGVQRHGQSVSKRRGGSSLVRSKLDAHVSKLDKYEKMFAIMPMMHAENLDAQRQCVAFVEKEVESGDGLWKNVLGHAKGHCDVIERFGRFPKETWR